jgi:hypothetical protein
MLLNHYIVTPKWYQQHQQLQRYASIPAFFNKYTIITTGATDRNSYWFTAGVTAVSLHRIHTISGTQPSEHLITLFQLISGCRSRMLLEL